MTNYSALPVPDDAEEGWLVHTDGSRVRARRWLPDDDRREVVGSEVLDKTFYTYTWPALGWEWRADS